MSRYRVESELRDIGKNRAKDKAKDSVMGNGEDNIKRNDNVKGNVDGNAADVNQKHELDCRVRACIRILEEQYGVPHGDEIDPVDLLVMTILSQNTSDINSLRAFGNLKKAFGDYELLINAYTPMVADKIRAGGLAEIKAKRIKETLLKIKTDNGAIDLGFLGRMGKDAAMQYLLSLPGVGPKTASVVLLFAFGLPFLPVDTHVYRVSRRLGLVAEEISLEKAQMILERVIPVEKYLSLHLNLIRHGRLICRARGPRHGECSLRPYCNCYLQGQKP